MSSTVPQVWRLWRSDGAEGVSLPSAVMGVAACAAWLGYGLLLRDATQVAANVPSLALALAVAILVITRTGRRALVPAAVCVTWAGALVALGAVGGVGAVGAAATATSLIGRVPQMWSAWRVSDLSGLAPSSFALSIVSSTLWVTYGLGTGQVPTWATSVFGAVLSAFILIRRCPPARVARALHAGRWGRPGRLLAAPVVFVLARA